MKNKVLIIGRDLEVIAGKVKALNLQGLEVLAPSGKSETEELAKEADIFLAIPSFAKPYLNFAPKLKWFQSIFAGIDNLIGEGLRTDYILTNVKDTYGQVMAEYALAYILAFDRDLFTYTHRQKEKIWQQKPYSPIKDKVLAILGTGSIGQDIAKAAKAFDMKTIGLRIKNEPVPYFDSIFTEIQIGEFLSSADYVISVLPRTKSTLNILNKKTLGLMKPSAVLINIGRGDAVDEKDLCDALNQGQIRAAVLDVFKEEPLPKESPLWDVKNLFITPHVSGYELNTKVFEIFAENYNRFIKGEDLLYQVDFQKGY